jgi:hypothetical protein
VQQTQEAAPKKAVSMNDVTKEALEYLVETGKKLSPIEQIKFGNRSYTRQEIKPVDEPLVAPIQISTLSSLADLCTGKFGDKGQTAFEDFQKGSHVIHVCSPTLVEVVAAQSNHWKRRETILQCKLTETAQLPLEKFLSQDEFIIALLSCCVQNEDRDYIAKLAGNATAEKISTAQDDGVSQTVGTRTGSHLQTQETVKNIVKLQLYRTFREVEQPESRFLFRLKQSGDNMPLFAFFQADGGAWKLTAVENIARYLRTKIPDAVIAS